MRVLIMGPPGAGKGTQAVRLRDALGVPHISTGDIFRANVEAQTALGRSAQRIMDRGEYVPDEITNGLVASRLAEADAAAGFILDGYPRTTDQVAQLDSWLDRDGQRLDAVLCLLVPQAELLSRLGARAGGRADDAEEVRRRRLEVYESETAPLITLFRGRGVLQEVSGVGTQEEVAARLLEALAKRRELDAPLARHHGG